MRRTEAPPAAPSPPAAAAAAGVPALLTKDAQFEMVTADEKFLAEATHMEISPLDSCHYRVKFRHSGLLFLALQRSWVFGHSPQIWWFE